MRFARRLRQALLAAGILAVLASASLAHADSKAIIYQNLFGPGSSRVSWQFSWHYWGEKTTPLPTCPCEGVLTAAQNFIGPNYVSPVAAPFLHVNTRGTATGGQLPPLNNNCVPAPGYVKTSGMNAYDRVFNLIRVTADGVGKVKVTLYPIAIGHAAAGGLITSATADTGFALDSLSVRVTKSGSSVTLGEFEGEMRNNPGLGGESISNTYSVAVYPDSNASNADATGAGNGALFYGRVLLTPAGALLTGGFSAGDFTCVRNPDGSQVVTPAPGLTKSVVVPNLAAATVVVIADPVSHRQDSTVLPGLPPIGGLILFALLVTSGLWLVSRRRYTRST